MSAIYHGCMLKNADGTNKIITNTENCITPTDQCLWKHPTVGYKEVDEYVASKYFIHWWKMGKHDTFFVQ